MNLRIIFGVLGLRYVFDPKRGNCTIDSTDKIWTTYLFNGPWDPTNINHIQSPGLFDLHNFEFNFHETVSTCQADALVRTSVFRRFCFSVIKIDKYINYN